MDLATENRLVETSLRLREVNRLIDKAFEEGNSKVIRAHLLEFLKLKKEIKTLLIDTPNANIRNIDAREIIRKISMEEPFPADEIWALIELDHEQKTGEKIPYDELDEDQIDKLGSDLFYSWFSHYDYIRNMYRIGSLILGISVPKELEIYVAEARRCCAFEQYNAVFSLCRTILEASIKHIIDKRNIINRKTGKPFDFGPKCCINDLICAVSRNKLRERIKDLYYEKTSPVVHGKISVGYQEAGDILKRTLEAVHELYDFHFHRHN